MNWGHKITLALILFGVFIFYLVYRAFQENVDLVTDDYYAQEINYDSKMQQKANLESLDSKATVVMEGDEVVIGFPTNSPTGEIHFYHLSRELFDQRVVIEVDEDNEQRISRKNLVSGRYRVNITWTSDGKEYFQQARIFIR